jgi:hypothetical protein
VRGKTGTGPCGQELFAARDILRRGFCWLGPDTNQEEAAHCVNHLLPGSFSLGKPRVELAKKDERHAFKVIPLGLPVCCCCVALESGLSMLPGFKKKHECLVLPLGVLACHCCAALDCNLWMLSWFMKTHVTWQFSVGVHISDRASHELPTHVGNTVW